MTAKTYYVSPSGLDTNPGTFDLPFLTISRAHSAMSTSGDTICVRGGVYPCSTTVTLSKSGTLSARLYLIAYPGERAFIDCSAMRMWDSNARGIRLSGSWWYVRGLDVWRAGDNGMNVSGSNNIIEFCTFSENGDTGLQLGGSASYNQVINCDSFFNFDTVGNADGFSPKLDVGTGTYFYGCRSWQNSDDGWDGYLSTSNDVTTTIENCWCFGNGYLKNDSISIGNGNGFKMGGSTNRDLMHNMILKNCIAFDNRVKGFDQNNNRGSMTLFNCTGYRSGTYNYSLASYVNYAAGKVITITNCLVMGSAGNISDSAVQVTDSWRPPFSPATASDFVSLDTTGVRGPRKPDGSLPDVNFLHLLPTSSFVDAGTNVGLPFNGSAPDLGAFETGATSAVGGEQCDIPSAFRVLPNYPNPFNPSTQFTVELPRAGRLMVHIYDVAGRSVCDLVDDDRAPGLHRILWNGRTALGAPAASGVYVARISFGEAVRTLKLVLLK